MRRKDCGNTSLAIARYGAGWLARPTLCAVSVVLAVGCLASDCPAGSVRLWPSALVVDETVRLSDVAELKGFDTGTGRLLTELVVTESPPAGGSRVVHMDLIRSVLAASGANMAKVTLGGAIQCAITRPADAARPDDGPAKPRRPGNRSRPARSAAGASGSNPFTLRQAVTDHFDAELARYGGRANLVFDRTSEQILDLSGPTYEFEIRRRGGSPLGLAQLEVDVLTGGRVVQTVPLVVRASILRRVVVAGRGVNQGATIKPADVELIALSFTRLNKLGLGDAAQVVGQRAKRFIPAGTLIEPDLLESVPLVTRGQLVTLTSVVGAIRVVTSAKAMQDGLFGETITVRAADKKRVEFDAVVVGPGTVQIGGERVTPGIVAIAFGGGS